MPNPSTVKIGLVSAGSPKTLIGEQGEDSPAYVTIDGRPLISYLLEQALRSQLEHLYIWTRPDRVDRLQGIVRELPNHDKVRVICPARTSMFSSLMDTTREFVTRDLLGRSDFTNWHDLLEFTADIPHARDTAVIHIPSDSPLLSAAELDAFCTDFDVATTDYAIGITQRELVHEVLVRHGLLEEFKQLPSTINNFTTIVDNLTHQPLSIRINNLHIFKPYMLEARQYEFLGRIFDQRKVSKISRWFQLAGLIRSIYQLPWLESEKSKRDLYATSWYLVRSQERLPPLLRKSPSEKISVRNVERNIGSLMKLRSRIYLDGRFGSFFDADAQEEYDFLRTHFATLATDPDL